MVTTCRVRRLKSQEKKNWMNLLRIAFAHAPKQTGAVMKKINKCDMQINALVGKLSKMNKK